MSEVTTISIYREDLEYLDNMAPNMKHKEILRMLIHFLKSIDVAIKTDTEVVYKGELTDEKRRNIPKTS